MEYGNVENPEALWIQVSMTGIFSFHTVNQRLILLPAIAEPHDTATEKALSLDA
jgi:hypothetical protein